MSLSSDIDMDHQAPHTKVAWLYCTWDGSLLHIGEITDEGSFKQIIDAHCHQFKGHEPYIHLIVQGSPQHQEMIDEAVEWQIDRLDGDSGLSARFPSDVRHNAEQGGQISVMAGRRLHERWGLPARLEDPYGRD